MDFTGERYVPSIGGDVELEHYHRYAMACAFVKGKTVLDIACGEGYGSALLSKSALKVFGVDIDTSVIKLAKKKYKAAGLQFRSGSCEAIPLGARAIDVVVSFETIEHHDQHLRMLAEIKRVLKPGGLLIISSPNKRVYSDIPKYSNPFHVKELYTREFASLIKSQFKNQHYIKQNVVYGSLMMSGKSADRLDYFSHNKKSKFTQPNFPSKYDLIIASDGALPKAKNSFFSRPIADVTVDFDAHIESLSSTLESVVADRDSKESAIETLESELATEIASRDAHIESLSSTLSDTLIDRNHLAHERELLRQLVDVGQENLALRDESIQSLKRIQEYQVAQIRAMESHLDRLEATVFFKIWEIARKYFGKRDMKFKRGPSSDISISTEGYISKPSSQRRILLVSYYSPGTAHAGALRILDLYATIKANSPETELHLLTHYRPQIDGDLAQVYEVFDEVFLSPVDVLSPEVLMSMTGENHFEYDVVDIQFHHAAKLRKAYKPYCRRLLYTPMESLARSVYISLRQRTLPLKNGGLKRYAADLALAAEELRFCQEIDIIVCVSRTDAQFLRYLTRRREVTYLETGISTLEFSEALSTDFSCSDIINKPKTIVYVAYFGSQTNIDALKWYLDEVHSRVATAVPGYKLKVIGRGDLSIFRNCNYDAVDFVGEVDAIAPHISDAKVGIAPALTGAGFRGKINQYAICGLPCVATKLAVTGLKYKNDEVRATNDPILFADFCIELLTNNEVNQRMAVKARDICLANYTWQSKWASIAQIYEL